MAAHHLRLISVRSLTINSILLLCNFEKTGQISLESFIKLTMELGMTNELEALFTTPVYTSIEEVIRDKMSKTTYVRIKP